jgi:protein-tyrosine phosphatase
MSTWDSLHIHNLNIRTIIDLRMDSEALATPINFPEIQVISIPATTSGEYVIQKVLDGRFRKGDAFLYMQDMFLQITEQTLPFSHALTVFADPKNYHIMIVDPNGKDAAGYLSALLFAVLAVPERIIVRDYTGGNQLINYKRYATLVQNADNNIQEALTTMLSTNHVFINLAIDKVKKEHGSISNYLRTELHLSKKQQERIKQIMLFPVK